MAGFGLSRRHFLRVGPRHDWLAARSAGAWAEASKSGLDAKDTCVIWLFLSGGPTQFETFDPKPGNPYPNSSVVGTVRTNVPGTHIGGLFPNFAKHADKYSIIRSFAHSQADHAAATHWLSTGKDYPPAGNGAAPIHPSIGSIVSRYRGPYRSYIGLPTYVRLESLYADGPAWLGAAHAVRFSRRHTLEHDPQSRSGSSNRPAWCRYTFNAGSQHRPQRAMSTRRVRGQAVELDAWQGSRCLRPVA